MASSEGGAESLRDETGWVVLSQDKYLQLLEAVRRKEPSAAPLPVVMYYPKGEEGVMNTHANLLRQANETHIRASDTTPIVTPVRYDVKDTQGNVSGTQIALWVERGPDDYQYSRHQQAGLKELQELVPAVNLAIDKSGRNFSKLPELPEVKVVFHSSK